MRTALRKICLLGEPGVGKTSLVQRLCGQPLPAPPARPGVSVRTHALPGPAGPLRVAFWDVAGRSAIDSLNQAFLRGADAFLGIGDATRPESLEAARLLLRAAHRLQPDARLMLLVNKRDRASAPCRPESSAEGSIPVLDVSALSGEGIAAAVEQLEAQLAG